MSLGNYPYDQRNYDRDREALSELIDSGIQCYLEKPSDGLTGGPRTFARYIGRDIDHTLIVVVFGEHPAFADDQVKPESVERFRTAEEILQAGWTVD